MSTLPNQQRLVPSLLDRLSDDDPGNERETYDGRAYTLRRLRESMLRDLSWLLNASSLSPLMDIASYDDSLAKRMLDTKEFPQAARSVLNYGIPDLTGRSVSGLVTARVEQLLRQAIRDFEPRILRQPFEVRALKDNPRANRTTLVFEIEGQLAAEPVPERLLLQTLVDFETGAVTIQDRSSTL